MTAPEALKKLEALGTAQNRKTYRRHGAGENLYGVSFANLYALRRQIKTDHELALELWKSGNDDARNLATMIADPARLTSSLLDTWAKGINNFVCGAFAQLAAQAPCGREKMESWVDDSSEWRACTGWAMLSHLAMEQNSLSDSFFKKYLKVIEKEIHQRPNWVRYSMNGALIGIGVRNPALTGAALKVAAKVGKVEVDHGETSCKTPDAAAYIEKTLAHRRKKK